MKNLVGLFDTRNDAEATIVRLKGVGIAPEAISVALKQADGTGSGLSPVSERTTPSLAEATGAHDLTAEGTTVGAVSGAAVGTLVGLLVAGSTVVLPGVGTLLIAGPLAAALTGAGVGAAGGGMLGALVGAGVPEAEAAGFANDVDEGRVIVVVRVDDLAAAEARRVFDEEGSHRTHLA